MTGQITYGTTVIDYTIYFSNRKTLGISVMPDGTIEVRAPANAPI